MQKQQPPTWQVALQAAVRETNPGLIEAKIQAAEAAISNRIGAALRGPGFAEEQALFEALETIRTLKSVSSLGHGEQRGTASAGVR
jgi:hypothetical protein